MRVEGPIIGFANPRRPRAAKPIGVISCGEPRLVLGLRLYPNLHRSRSRSHGCRSARSSRVESEIGISANVKGSRLCRESATPTCDLLCGRSGPPRTALTEKGDRARPERKAEQCRHGPRSMASRRYALLAGLFWAVNLVLWIHAIADVGAGVATVLGNLQVLFVAAFAWALLRERPDRRYRVTLPVVLLGVVMVSGLTRGGGTGLHPAAGVAYGAATSAAYACMLLILRQTAGRARHVAGQLFDATAGAAAGSLLLGLAFGGLQLAIPWRSLGWLLVLVLICGIVGWLLITAALPRLPAALSSLLLLLEPAGAMLLAAIVLGQRPSLIQIAGAVLVCGGVLIVARNQERDPGKAVTGDMAPQAVTRTDPGPVRRSTVRAL
jgi:drug/metabolite transporter (DMT)-like permease